MILQYEYNEKLQKYQDKGMQYMDRGDVSHVFLQLAQSKVNLPL